MLCMKPSPLQNHIQKEGRLHLTNGNGTTNILEVKQVSKYFPGVQALNNVDFSIAQGEIHGLIGENGAGKSTLIKIISGSLPRDGGQMYFDGQDYNPKDSNQALSRGIATVYQELSLCENMNVAENLLINRHPKRGFLIDFKKLNDLTLNYLKKFELKISPNNKVEELPLAQRELVEILRALSYQPKLLILDEPSEPLSKADTDKLFSLLYDIRDKGTSILYISHNIAEVMEISDRITILRDGEKVKTVQPTDISENELSNLMVGRDIGDIYSGVKTKPQEEIVLEVQDLSSGERVRNANFKLRKGEIFGIAGLVGAGRTDLALTIFGYRKITSGQILVNGQPAVIKSPRDAMKHKIAYLSEDRHLLGLFLPYTISENLLSNNLKQFSRYNLLDIRKLNYVTQQYIEDLNIKCSGVNQRVNNLSGGNQQKTMVAKWMATEPEILIFDEPTRGIDVGAKKAIHELLREIAGEGRSIIMISSELPEVLRMSDRIMIMDRGYTVDIVENSDSITEEYIMNAIMNFKKGRNKDG